MGELAKRGMLTLLADEDKKKYFKILPNHVAPQGAKYSQEGVKKEREVEKVGCWFFRLCGALSWLFLFVASMPVPISTRL